MERILALKPDDLEERVTSDILEQAKFGKAV
jgi:hypothetical protein